MMKNLYNLKWKLRVLLVMALQLRPSEQSIAGVTYMDDFDFEERYSNVHECDPFYWHPLHLPEHCADMFENLIRSRLPGHVGFAKPRDREQKKREKEEKERQRQKQEEVYALDLSGIQLKYPEESFESNYENYYHEPQFRHRHSRRHRHHQSSDEEEESEPDTPVFQFNEDPNEQYYNDNSYDNSYVNAYENYESQYNTRAANQPVNKILSLLQNDAGKHPSAPTYGFMPNLGQVAMYRQPISKSSLKLIKQITAEYRKQELKKKNAQTEKTNTAKSKGRSKKTKKKHGHHRKHKN